jgi:hypothetical protein
METNGKHHESWYTFIKHDGNEEALQHLKQQLDKIEFFILDDLSVFDLELEHLVSEETAREMINLVLNSVMYHRKFDGTLKKIDLGISRKDSDNKKLIKCFNILGVGGIDQFIDKEEDNTIPEDPNASSESSNSDDESDSEEYFYPDSDEESEESSSSSHHKKKKHSKKEEKKRQREKLVEKIRKMKEKN